MTLSELKNKKIAVLGSGVNNRSLIEYLKKQDIDVEIFDKWENPEELIGKIEGFDIVFRTPGLPFLSKPIQQALSRGVVISSQTKLFFDLCPAKIVGVTGTKGKGTTASLISKILGEAAFRQAQGRKVYLAGNIGQDPFAFLDKVKPSDWVVLELSSFQLQDLHKSPHVAVVLKITPEHLDHHKDFEEYLLAKKQIVRHQGTSDMAVLNYDLETVRAFAGATPAQIIWNSNVSEVKPGCFVENEKIVLQDGSGATPILPVSEVQLLGQFNLENVTASIAAAYACGVREFEAIRQTVKDFQGLPHRLEFVAEIKGVKFYNDSFSTTPETAIAAISAFDSPLVLIVGGSEKNADYHELARVIAQSKIAALVPIGITGPKIANFAREAGYDGRIIDKKFEDMEEVVREANLAASIDEIVLLSPASASFDMFTNYKQRGELFTKFVKNLDGKQN